MRHVSSPHWFYSRFLKHLSGLQWRFLSGTKNVKNLRISVKSLNNLSRLKKTKKDPPPQKKNHHKKAQLEIYNLSLLKIFLGDRFINHICKKQIIKVKERTIEKAYRIKKKR